MASELERATDMLMAGHRPFGKDDENNSRAPTPDLVSCSSTENSSPHTISSVEVASQPIDLRTRTWKFKEIDHGEATYYNSTTEWKWDSPMPLHESDVPPFFPSILP